MTNEEVNNFINEFMENKKEITTAGGGVVEMYAKNYTQSLDALVPVWEKLGISYFDCDMNHGNKNISMVFIKHFPKEKPTYKTGLIYGKTIQEAAAMATAKAILELKEVK